MIYGNNDWRDYLQHSWGKKPEQKAKEKAYNARYYQLHKEKWRTPLNKLEDAVAEGKKHIDRVKGKAKRFASAFEFHTNPKTEDEPKKKKTGKKTLFSLKVGGKEAVNISVGKSPESSLPKNREKNVTGVGNGVARRGSGLNSSGPMQQDAGITQKKKKR